MSRRSSHALSSKLGVVGVELRRSLTAKTKRQESVPMYSDQIDIEMLTLSSTLLGIREKRSGERERRKKEEREKRRKRRRNTRAPTRALCPPPRADSQFNETTSLSTF